ncbi:response regulator [Aurantivibrio plasticivorans]
MDGMAYSGYQNIKALVVDDFESFRQMLANMLESFGIASIDSAVTGNEVMRWCQEKDFDLILCDYNLGRGKNGQQILEELRHKTILSRKTLFILISAESSKAIVMSAYDYEPDAYLAKPITGKALKQRLDRLLQQRDEMFPIYQAIDDKNLPKATDLLNRQIMAGSRISTPCQKLLGELYLESGQIDLAEDIYRRALQVRTLDWAKVGMAKVRELQGNKGEAKTFLKEIIKKNPLCMQAYDALAGIYRKEEDDEALSEVLKSAVEQSPMAILRQESLAKHAIKVNDNFTAAQAFRQTVRLGTNSVHDKLDNHIQFGRSTAQLLRDDQSAAVDLSREVIKDLEEVGSRFAMSEEQSVMTLFVESQVLAGQGNTRKAKEVLQMAEEKYSTLETESDLDTDLSMAQALKDTGNKEASDQVLSRLVQEYKNDQPALEKIDPYLDEPISQRNRGTVTSINKRGIGFYEANKFEEAIRCFDSARKLFPNHIGIQLNLVQSIDGELRARGYDKETYYKAMRIIDIVKRNITGDHPQYDRYLQLQDMIGAHSREV